MTATANKTLALALLLGAGLALAVTAFAEEAEVAPDKIATKAGELVAERTTRLEKLAAVHRYVRDEIREVKTRYS